MTSDRELILRAAALARSSPHAWADFITALQLRSEEKQETLVSSPLDSLQLTQGRAQEVRDLLKLFKNASVDAVRIEQKIAGVYPSAKAQSFTA